MLWIFSQSFDTMQPLFLFFFVCVMDCHKIKIHLFMHAFTFTCPVVKTDVSFDW